MAIAISQAGGILVKNGIYRSTFYTWVAGQYGLMTQDWFLSGSAAPPNTLGDFAFDLQTAVDAVLQPLVATEVKILGCKVNQLMPATPKPLAGIATSTSIGSAASPTGPKQAALVITKSSLTSGRTGRGRMFVPFIPTASIDAGGEIEPTVALPRYTTFYNAIFGFSAITTGGGPTPVILVVFNRKTGGFTGQTTFRVNAKIGTQRRRGDYGRTNPQSIV